MPYWVSWRIVAGGGSDGTATFSLQECIKHPESARRQELSNRGVHNRALSPVIPDVRPDREGRRPRSRQRLTPGRLDLKK